MHSYSFIKRRKRIPLKDLKLVKRTDGGFRKHPSDFFKRNCLSKLESRGDQDLANKLNIEIEALKQFMEGNIESPRVHRRPVCLSQATLPDSFKLS